MNVRIVDDNFKPSPVMSIMHKPSNITGIAFYLCLDYGNHHFEALLPPNFMALTQTEQNLTVLPLAEELRMQLAPILIAEDSYDKIVTDLES